MALIISTTKSTGSSLVATIQRDSDSFWWNDSSEAFEASPSFANKSITLVEGSGEYIGSYSASPASSLGTEDVTIFIHDVDSNDLVVGRESLALTAGEETNTTRTDQELVDAVALTVPTGKSDTFYDHVGSTFSGSALANVPVPEQFLVVVPPRGSTNDLATIAPLYIQPNEKVLTGVDFTNVVAAGDYIAEIDTITELNDKTITLEEIGTTEKVAKLWISGCIVAEQYRISVTVTTHFGIKLEGDFFVHTAF